jgi:hypothetical protein
MEWEPTSAPEEKKGLQPAQAGSILFIVLTVIVLLCYAVIFINPQIVFNPFKPPMVAFPTATMSAMASTPTLTPLPTSTPRQPFPPTWTPTATPTPTVTRTPTPTGTPIPPTSTPAPLPPFSVYDGPIFIKQQLYPEAADWWSGVAGEVTDRNGRAVTDVTIRIWDAEGHVWETQPGNAPEYGEEYGSVYSGRGTYAWWEQFLEISCQEGIKVNVQAISGNAKSRVVTFNTTGTCDKNLVLIHFQKNY